MRFKILGLIRAFGDRNFSIKNIQFISVTVYGCMLKFLQLCNNRNSIENMHKAHRNFMFKNLTLLRELEKGF